MKSLQQISLQLIAESRGHTVTNNARLWLSAWGELPTEDEIASVKLEALKIRKPMTLGNKRYHEEIAGFTLSETDTVLDGKFVRTDERSQQKISDGLLLATRDPDNFSRDWKFSDTWVELNAELMILIATKFEEFQQATRAKLKAKEEAVASATSIEDVQAITWAS